MNLNSIKIKTTKRSKRLGRGIGSGKGKTCGRGHKGQKSRSGVAIKSFEGGQMPLYRRLPKRGFINFNKDRLVALINLSKIQELCEKNILSPDNKINLALLKKINLINKKYLKLKILGSGELKNKCDFEVNAISSSAKDKVEKLGGKISLIK